jgi:hypothetical protein
VKIFQDKHENTNADGWVGAKTERLLMLRTATVPPGRSKALRDVKLDPVVPAWDVPVPDDPIPELSGASYRFEGSDGINISASIFGVSAGYLDLKEMSKGTMVRLSYAALGLGASPIPAAIDVSDADLDSIGGIYPSPLRGETELTLNDKTGWCLIYSGVLISGVRPGGSLTLMFLSGVQQRLDEYRRLRGDRLFVAGRRPGTHRPAQEDAARWSIALNAWVARRRAASAAGDAAPMPK